MTNSEKEMYQPGKCVFFAFKRLYLDETGGRPPVELKNQHVLVLETSRNLELGCVKLKVLTSHGVVGIVVFTYSEVM